LKFSEIYFAEIGKKVFDIKIGSHTVFKNLDPLGNAHGQNMPFDVFVDISILRGKIYIDNSEVKGATKF
jgi:hypothetical protein